MKTLLALVATVVTVSGYLIHVPVAPIAEPTLAPAGWIHMQKLILPLFENVCEESNNPAILRLSQEFLTTTSAAEFWDSDCFLQLQQLKSANKLLVKGEIFTEYNSEHISELKIVFGVLKNAKTFDTFYKAASWARQNVNCGLYVDAIYLALENRRDTDKLTLPAPYELLPNYFIRKDIIIQGSSLLAGQEITPSAGVRDEGNAYTLDANYTATVNDNDDESKLAYFREDIGLNSYYFLNMLKCAPWRNVDVDINSRYGEEMYFWMKQWMSRYNMERYSNGLAEINGLSWDLIADIPYDPMLVYSNGNEFIHRSSLINVEENEDKALLKNIETNLATVVGHMRDSGYNKTQILNHLMEILVTGERSYDTLARRLLGKALSNNGNLSVLEHYMTSLRDPLFWKLNKKIVDLIDNALKVLPAYTKNELYFPGVEVVNVEVKKMITSFENFQFDITDALKIGNGDTTFQVKIGQSRLTHKPFTMKINITSLVTQKGMVKIYLGPKVMPGEFSNNKNLFCLLDCFDINLKRGGNIISRSSEGLTRFSPDFVSLKTLRKNVEDAQFGLDSLPLNSINSQIQYPSRMILPKGTPEGLPLQLLVYVAPYMKTSLTRMYSATSMEFNEAIMSKMYPLDLPIDDNMLLGLPNLMFKDISVSFKGVGNGDSGSSNGYGGRPAQPNLWGREQDEMSSVDNFDMHQMVQNDGSITGTKQTLKYDYASKKNGNYKKFDYKNINKDIHSTTSDVPTEIPIEVPTEMPEDIVIVTNPETTVVNAENLDFSPYEMQNDEPVGGSVLADTTPKKDFDYKTQRLEKKFDYSKFKNFDYKDKSVTAKVTTDVPTEATTQVDGMGISTVKHVDIEIFRTPDRALKKDDITVEVFEANSKEEENYNDRMQFFKVLQADDNDQETRVVPLLKLSVPLQKAFTIYDYIHSLSNDEKIEADSHKEENEELKNKFKSDNMISYIRTSS